MSTKGIAINFFSETPSASLASETIDHTPTHPTDSIRGICVGESSVHEASLAVMDASRSILTHPPKLGETHRGIGVHRSP